MIDIQKAIDVIRVEKECVSRQQCDRDCGKCDLIMESEEILSAYDIAIAALQEKLRRKRWKEWRRNRKIGAYSRKIATR